MTRRIPGVKVNSSVDQQEAKEGQGSRLNLPSIDLRSVQFHGHDGEVELFDLLGLEVVVGGDAIGQDYWEL